MSLTHDNKNEVTSGWFTIKREDITKAAMEFYGVSREELERPLTQAERDLLHTILGDKG